MSACYPERDGAQCGELGTEAYGSAVFDEVVEEHRLQVVLGHEAGVTGLIARASASVG